MTIEELRKELKDAEGVIAKELLALESRSGCAVEGIELRQTDCSTVNSRNQEMRLVCVRVKLSVQS